MATVSFDEKVVVTDPEMVAKMRKDLEDPTPVVIKRKTLVEKCTIQKMEENTLNWISANLK